MKLGLGTVQFGLDYGVSNKQGITPNDKVKDILKYSHKEGIAVLDTAALYGKSEEVMGMSLLPEYDFNIITKTPQFKKLKINRNDASDLNVSFEESLAKIGRHNVYGLLVHHADDLLAENGEYLMDAMLHLKAQGLVKKIGVSIYDGEQIDQILDRYSIDIVQVPINVFDQRLATSGKLGKLKDAQIEIHARSIFLQGLLLMEPRDAGGYFNEFRPDLQRYQDVLKSHEISPIHAALAYVNSQPEIDYAIVGVTSASELEQITRAFNNLPRLLPDWAEFACNDLHIINPAYWPQS